MKDEITLNESVKEAIEIAFVRLIQKKNMGKITVTELTNLAGVGRSSFYRNFDDIESVAVEYMNRIYKEYFEKRPINPNIYQKRYFDYFLVERFKIIRSHAEFFTALNNNGILYSVMKKMDPEIKRKFLVADISESRYFNAMLMDFSTGIIEEWISGGMKESEDEIANIVKSCLYSMVESLKESF